MSEALTPAMKVWVSTCVDCTGALMIQPELEAATETAPRPAIEIERASYVPEEVPKVLEEA